MNRVQFRSNIIAAIGSTSAILCATPSFAQSVSGSEERSVAVPNGAELASFAQSVPGSEDHSAAVPNAAAPESFAQSVPGSGDRSAVVPNATALESFAQGGSGSEKRATSFRITLNQDNFFGFNPAFQGNVPINATTDFTFYGTFWTKPAFGLGPVNAGDDLWTEFGVGMNFLAADGKLSINPQIGITNGALLSGGARSPSVITGGVAAPRAVTGSNFADGLVPSLTVNYLDTKLEAELYAGYYAALRQRSGNASLDFLHTWVNAGYRFSSLVSAGAHYELLSNTRNTYPGGRTARVYQWVGPYVQFTLPRGFFARLTAGADVERGSSGDFYKMTAGFRF